jgi:peptidoglycan-N-acetylglucosamine deacetylase
MLPWKKYSLVIILLLICLLQAAPPIIERLPTKNKVVALTFDDGPRNSNIEELLDLLCSQNIQATFFVIGKSVKTDPDLIYRLQREGHDIGNHTYNHKRLDNLPEEKILAEIQDNNTLLVSIIKKPVKYFRAPGGRYSKTVYQVLRKLNLLAVNWSLNTGDYNLESPVYLDGDPVYLRSAEKIEAGILNNVQPGDIILLHTGNPESIAALKTVIPELRKRGYRFAKISEFY